MTDDLERSWLSALHPRDTQGQFAIKLAGDVQSLARSTGGRNPVAAGHLSRAADAITAGDRESARTHLTAAYESIAAPLRGRGKRFDAEHKAAQAPLDAIRRHLNAVDQLTDSPVSHDGKPYHADPALAAKAADWRAKHKLPAGGPVSGGQGFTDYTRRAALARAGTNPEPLGKPGGPGLFHVKGLGLPVMIQHVRNDLMQKRGMPEARATAMAIGVVRDWAHGHDGKGNAVHPDTVAQATAAVAEYDRDRAKAKATRSTTMADQYDADGLDGSWDDTDDLPDMTGLEMADLDEAAAGDPEFRGWAGSGDVSRAAKLGTGSRFAALKAKLAAKGVKDPGALAAHIGRRKFGKGKFQKLAAKARKGAPAAASRSGVAAGEIFRFFPLEECRIMRASEGRDEYGSGRVVEAYAAVFDQDAEIRDHEGHYVENIDQTAFDEVLRMIAPERNRGFWNATCLYNHGMTIHGTPAERFSLPAGVPKHIASEGQGLLTRTEYAPTPLGDELLSLVEMGALRTQSFTGSIMRSTPALRGPGDRYRARGGVLERVKRLVLGLREYGLTPFAAYSGAEVLGVRMQLPGAFTDVGDLDSAEFEETDPAEDGEAGDGSPPEDGTATRSTGNRLYQLRTQEMLAQHGITLDD